MRHFHYIVYYIVYNDSLTHNVQNVSDGNLKSKAGHQ